MNGISTKSAITIATLATSLIITTALMINYQNNQVMAYPRGYEKGNTTFGTIASIQNDENSNPSWIVAGHWKTNLLNNQSQSSSSQGNTTSSSSPSASSGSVFNTSFRMVKLDGTANHTHTITNFVLVNTSMPNNMTRIFNGTSTASLKEGPATDIPTSIRIMGDKVISIWLDPSKVNNHFGNTPIYGMVMDEHGDRQGYLKGKSTQMGNSSWTK